VTNQAAATSPQKYARIAGLLYVVVIVTGAFAHFSVRSKLIMPGDSASTAANIMTSEWLFRLSIASDLIATLCYFLLAFVLYSLLKPVGKNIALLFLLVVTISSAIFCLNFLNQFAPLLLLGDAGYLSALDQTERQALALFFLDMHGYGYVIANVFFGGWLFPMGYLVFKSGFFPKSLGVLLMLAAFGYLIPFFTAFLFPNYEVVAYPGLVVAVIAEVSFCLWLLIKGVKVQVGPVGV